MVKNVLINVYKLGGVTPLVADTTNDISNTDTDAQILSYIGQPHHVGCIDKPPLIH